MEEILELEQSLAVEFNDYSLISRALTHRSFLNENPGSILEDNERLEFLGDAVIDFIVGSYLYHRFPEMDEGELTSLRAALVRTRTLAGFAQEWDLGRFIRLGYGEAESGGRERLPILCAAFEAVIGAIYLDQGLDSVNALLLPLVSRSLVNILDAALYKDPKSEFQVWAQAEYNVTPRYEMISATGPDHAKLFTVQALVGEEVWGEGSGRSKQLAAQAAAAVALANVEERDQLQDQAS